MFETFNPADISEMSMLVLQDTQFELRHFPLDEQQAALEDIKDTSIALDNIVDNIFKIVTQVAYVPDPDSYTDQYFHKHRNLSFTGGASGIKFREPFDEYGGLVVTFSTPHVQNIRAAQAREIKQQGLVVPILAIAECVKLGHISS